MKFLDIVYFAALMASKIFLELASAAFRATACSRYPFAFAI